MGADAALFTLAHFRHFLNDRHDLKFSEVLFLPRTLANSLSFLWCQLCQLRPFPF
jgi:hypothetical protein